MARKCDYCGRIERSFLFSHSFNAVGGTAKMDGKKYVFCSDGCSREFTKQRQSNQIRNQFAQQESERNKQLAEQKQQLDNARSFRLLQQGVDFQHWSSDCNECGNSLLYPSMTVECEDCGTDRHLELRQYADGHNRVMCCCSVCKTELTLRGLDCDCGGRASAAKIKVLDTNGIESHGNVVFKSPEKITASDFVSSPQIASQKSKSVTWLIWLLLGVIGGHRFYVGKFFTGFLFLITFGFFWIGWIIDGLLLLTGSFKDAEGRNV